jgi:hypothetical protein
MGLAVGVWTTVARRPARVATELVGGKALAHDWAAAVRKYVPHANKAAVDGIFCCPTRFARKKDCDQLAKSERNAAKKR